MLVSLNPNYVRPSGGAQPFVWTAQRALALDAQGRRTAKCWLKNGQKPTGLSRYAGAVAAFAFKSDALADGHGGLAEISLLPPSSYRHKGASGISEDLFF